MEIDAFMIHLQHTCTFAFIHKQTQKYCGLPRFIRLTAAISKSRVTQLTTTIQQANQ